MSAVFEHIEMAYDIQICFLWHEKKKIFFSILILYTSKEKTNDLPGPPED